MIGDFNSRVGKEINEINETIGLQLWWKELREEISVGILRKK